jgi:hypothetical protein
MSSSETSFAGLVFRDDFLDLIENMRYLTPKNFSSYTIGKVKYTFQVSRGRIEIIHQCRHYYERHFS